MRKLYAKAKEGLKDAAQQHNTASTPSSSGLGSPGSPPPIPPRPENAQHPAEQTQGQHVASNDFHPPAASDVLRYRYHHGACLGSIFVLEKWLTPSMFPSAAGGNQSSELEAVKLSVAERGLDATREKWEKHWSSAIKDADIEWLLKEGKCKLITKRTLLFT